jgi:hypothetical protein
MLLALYWYFCSRVNNDFFFFLAEGNMSLSIFGGLKLFWNIFDISQKWRSLHFSYRTSRTFHRTEGSWCLRIERGIRIHSNQ